MTRPRAAVDRACRFAAGSLMVVLAVLPALVAGRNLDVPPRAAELARLDAALGGAEDGAAAPAGSLVAGLFYTSALWSRPPSLPAGDEARRELVVRARLAQVLGIAAFGFLVYLATLFARGRAQALVACALLCALPPICAEGHVLRPETPAAVFAALALVLLQCVPAAQRDAGRLRPRRRAVVLFALAASVAWAHGMAVAALPASGTQLLLPGVVLIVIALQLGLRTVRAVRRRGLGSLPLRALNRRLWPWTAASLLVPLVAALLLGATLRVPADALPASTAGVGLLPEAAWARVPLLVLLALGAVGGVLRTGLRFGRRGHAGPDFVLLLYCGVQLAAAFGGGADHDRLPACGAMAVLLAEGLFLGVLFAGVARAAWRRRRGE